MAANLLARKSKGQSVGSEAGSISGARQFTAANAESQIPDSEDNRSAFRGRKNSSRSRNPTLFSRSRSRGRADEKRPGKAGRFSRSKSRSRKESGETRNRLHRSRSGRTSTSKCEEVVRDLADLRPPQRMRIDCVNAQENDSMIGVAVGSPSQLQPTDHDPPLGQSRLATMETELLNSSDHHFEESANKNKGARWKKIGGLFKARNALTNEPAPSPFYQLQLQYAAQEANQSASSLNSRSIDAAPGNQDAKFLFDKILGSQGQLEPQNYVGNPPHRGQAGTEHPSAQRPSKQNHSRSGLPLLDVQIPDVQMDRYSVMFGNLLDKQDSPNLLARRDKNLNKLLTISDEDEQRSGDAPVQTQKPEGSETTSNNRDQSHLTPEAHGTYPRRATSPTPSKSPSFSLFPHLPQAPEKIVGPIPPGNQSPLQRSFTAPARLSPMQESFELDEPQNPKAQDLTTDHEATAGPLQTSRTSDSEKHSSQPAATSTPSPRSSVNEDVLLEINSQHVSKKKQDQVDLTNDQELKVAPLKPRHDTKDANRGFATGHKAEDKIPKTNRNDVHEDTLATLERPRSIGSKSKDASISLKPSKARIDQIMRGPRPHPHPESPAEIKDGQDAPKNSQFKDNTVLSPKLTNAIPPRTELASSTREVATPAGSAAVLAAREKPSVMSLGQETASKTTHNHPKNELESHHLQQSTGSQLPPQDSRGTPNALGWQHPNAAHRQDTQNVIDFRPRQPVQPSQTDKRRPPQSSHRQAQFRPPPANTSHRLHPRANAPPPGRPPFDVSNRSFPTYVPPPSNFTMRSQPPFDQMDPHLRPGDSPAATPPSEKDQDNILDYYLDDTESNSSSRRSKSPKKLQKRHSNTSKKRFSLSSKPLPYPERGPKPFHASNSGPQSPVPISKYSANAAALQKPVISPPISSSTDTHNHSQSRSLTLTKKDSEDLRTRSPAVRAAREKAAQLIKISSAEDLSLTQTHSTSVSGVPRRPPQAEFSFVVDGPNMTTPNQTSFYSHSNTSTPSLPNTNSASHSADEGSGFTCAEQAAKPPIPKRSPSRGASLNNLPPGAGGVRTIPTTPKPPQPLRSASAGTVGVGAGGGPSGIQRHLKPEKGEKVVERQAGLVATIMDPKRERGHRAGRSVNLIIESV